MRNRQIEQNNGCQHKCPTDQPSDDRFHASHNGSLARIHPGQSLGVQQLGQDGAQHAAAQCHDDRLRRGKHKTACTGCKVDKTPMAANSIV